MNWLHIHVSGQVELPRTVAPEGGPISFSQWEQVVHITNISEAALQNDCEALRSWLSEAIAARRRKQQTVTVDSLVAMGFDQDKIESELDRSKGNVPAAVERLVQYKLHGEAASAPTAEPGKNSATSMLQLDLTVSGTCHGWSPTIQPTGGDRNQPFAVGSRIEFFGLEVQKWRRYNGTQGTIVAQSVAAKQNGKASVVADLDIGTENQGKHYNISFESIRPLNAESASAEDPMDDDLDNGVITAPSQPSATFNAAPASGPFGALAASMFGAQPPPSMFGSAPHFAGRQPQRGGPSVVLGMLDGSTLADDAADAEVSMYRCATVTFNDATEANDMRKLLHARDLVGRQVIVLDPPELVNFVEVATGDGESRNQRNQIGAAVVGTMPATLDAKLLVYVCTQTAPLRMQAKALKPVWEDSPDLLVQKELVGKHEPCGLHPTVPSTRYGRAEYRLVNGHEILT